MPFDDKSTPSSTDLIILSDDDTIDYFGPTASHGSGAAAAAAAGSKPAYIAPGHPAMMHGMGHLMPGSNFAGHGHGAAAAAAAAGSSDSYSPQIRNGKDGGKTVLILDDGTSSRHSHYTDSDGVGAAAAAAAGHGPFYGGHDYALVPDFSIGVPSAQPYSGGFGGGAAAAAAAAGGHDQHSPVYGTSPDGTQIFLSTGKGGDYGTHFVDDGSSAAAAAAAATGGAHDFVYPTTGPHFHETGMHPFMTGYGDVAGSGAAAAAAAGSSSSAYGPTHSTDSGMTLLVLDDDSGSSGAYYPKGDSGAAAAAAAGTSKGFADGFPHPVFPTSFDQFMPGGGLNFGDGASAAAAAAVSKTGKDMPFDDKSTPSSTDLIIFSDDDTIDYFGPSASHGSGAAAAAAAFASKSAYRVPAFIHSQEYLLPGDFISRDHSPEFFGVSTVKCSSELCPSVTDSSQCPDSCEDGYVCDGHKCVLTHECPCTRGLFTRQPGSVWKEDDGCTNCLCMDGVPECVAEVCSVTSCDAAQVLSPPQDGNCCPSCVPANITCESSGQIYKIGDLWNDPSDPCSECTCTENGAECNAKACMPSVVPICSSGEVLKEAIVNCCTEFSCVCDVTLCPEPVVDCPVAHEVVKIESTEGCCPEYQCVCRPERCEQVYCMAGEKLIQKSSPTECCPEYSCERMGCTDETNAKREIGDSWTPGDALCERCMCTADERIVCRPKECPPAAPSCPLGQRAIPVRSADGCCTSYVCDCSCKGYAHATIEMFSGESYTASCTCSHDLVRDITARSFRVYIKRIQCVEGDEASGVCLDKIVLHDITTGVEAQISKNLKITVGHDVYDMTGRDSVLDNGYSIRKLGSSSVVTTMTSSGLTLTYDSNSDMWDVNVPTDYAGNVEGLCGMCDGSTSAKGVYVVGGHEVALQQHLDHYLVETESCSPLPDIPIIEDCPGAMACAEVFTSGVFATCTPVVPPSDYMGRCVEAASAVAYQGSGIEDGTCASIAAYAQKCASHGECAEWRHEDLCPYTCPVGRVYQACGPSIERTCDNFRTYANMRISYNVEGCFCPGDQVLLNGECIGALQCPVCMDETRTPRHAGEQWQLATDACVYVVCQEDGTMLQSTTSCPSAPFCDTNQVLHKVVDGPCCPIYVCEGIDREEDCASVSCLSTGVPVCNTGEETVAISTGLSGCCFEYECQCRSHLCPFVMEPSCETGEVLVIKNSESCCPTKVCECDETKCPPTTEFCATGYVRKLTKSTRCCQEYGCVCDYAWCEEPLLSCKAGETLITHKTEGCCATYSCECDVTLCPAQTTSCAYGYTPEPRTNPGDCCQSYECVCDVSACPVTSSVSCPTEEGYRMIKTGVALRGVSVPSCCPAQYESTCVCDISLCSKSDVVCGAYERKYQINPGACCPIYACECDQTTCPLSEIQTCGTNKKLVKITENSCCSRFTCECDVCPEPQVCKDGWEFDDVLDDCGCVCRTCLPPTACISDGSRFEPGSFWMDDVCTECMCSDTAGKSGEYEVTCTAIKCGTCSAGYIYVPVAGQCCGDCVPSMCHYGGQTYTVGQTWSTGSCTTCSCETDPITNEVYSSCVSTTCPPMDGDCADEDLRTTADGCCTYCAKTSDACQPQIHGYDFITVDGCTSTERVNVTKCAGSCNSESVFSFEESKYVRQCTCCTTAQTRKVEVELTCLDDSTKMHAIDLAETCACQRSSCSP